jgi:succinate-semialdehyde dehydrogenase/glutarate-semialdehyde dehydrogenase
MQNNQFMMSRPVQQQPMQMQPVAKRLVFGGSGEDEEEDPASLSRESDVDAAYASARRAQPAWADLSVRERCRIVLRFHDLVLAHRDEALDILQWENGKARRDAVEEVVDVAITARHYARNSAKLLRPRHRRGAVPGAVGVLELRHPKGVVGVIAPWNYPLTLAVSDAIPALIAGNAVVLKPDLQTSLIALWAVDLLRQAGLPRDVMQVVIGDGPDLGPLVIDRSDYVMFTGSTRVGREVAQRCGERLIGCSLELGGKNAMIVRADARVDRAAEIATRACFANSGQLCVSMERAYIQDAVYDEFVAAFVSHTTGLMLKSGIGWGADVGSLISARQRDRVMAYIDDAVARGARVLAGGRPRPDIGPYFVEPTILDRVVPGMALCAEETFGPVVALQRVASDDEAVELANDTAYGLHSVILTRDAAAGRRLAARLRVGTVSINEAHGPAWGSTRAPMGGVGDSGLGRRHGEEGLLKYTESQAIATQRILGFSAPSGVSDERWGGLLTGAIGLMKRLGLK